MVYRSLRQYGAGEAGRVRATLVLRADCRRRGADSPVSPASWLTILTVPIILVKITRSGFTEPRLLLHMVSLAAFRAARMCGASRLIQISQGNMVMAGASMARASMCARIVTGAAIVAAVMTVGGSQSSWADPPAPI